MPTTQEALSTTNWRHRKSAGHRGGHWPALLTTFAGLPTILIRPPSDIVDSPYLARQLGVTPTRITQMVRSGEIPKGCIVPGTGDGRPWKFYRRRTEEWRAKTVKVDLTSAVDVYTGERFSGCANGSQKENVKK